MVCSLDGCGAWRNPHHAAHAGSKVATDGKWYHIDQNFAKTPDRVGFQGLVQLTPADEHSGSLVVVPGSHGDYRDNCERGGKTARGNFTRLSARHDGLYAARVQPALARLVAYVACAPRADVDDATAAKRRLAVARGRGGGAFSTTLASNVHGGPPVDGYAPPPADSPRWALV
ncbi:hypothetical protein JL720_12985 [Aureococcus anophagefferens]|nr:hypothetical protein JL720_12985 [Aureococcus anophagefferens]